MFPTKRKRRGRTGGGPARPARVQRTHTDDNTARLNRRVDQVEELRPAIECRLLPVFEPMNLAAVRRAFRNAGRLTLRQAWREKTETGFAPGTVYLGWRSTSFLIFAELTDTDIYTRVTGDNQPSWLRGDTFEIFLRPLGQQAYVEFHVTPNNHHLQLRYRNAAAFDRARRNGDVTDALIAGRAFRSLTWPRPEEDRWFVYAEIPARSVCGRAKSLRGQTWRFSFGRYDYRRHGGNPVLSSSSAHAEPDFHRQHEWGTLIFTPPARGTSDD